MPVNRGIYRNTTPKITWGAAFANTLVFDRPLDDAVCYSEETQPGQMLDAMLGDEGDGWTWKERGVLTGIVHRIPRVTTGGITGWEGATGWDAFLAWASDANPFRFYPDATAGTYWLSLLHDQERQPDEEPNRMRMLALSIRQADNAIFVGY